MSADSTPGPPDTSGSGDSTGGSNGSVDPVGSLGQDSGPGFGARVGAVAGWITRAAHGLAAAQRNEVVTKSESGP